MEDFDRTVLEFVTEYPASATLMKQTEGEYDPTTGTVETFVEEIPIQGIIMDLTLQSNGLSTKYNTLVETGDKEMFLRPPHKTNSLATPVEITPSDKILAGGTEYKVVTQKELNPTGNDPVLVMLYLRLAGK